MIPGAPRQVYTPTPGLDAKIRLVRPSVGFREVTVPTNEGRAKAEREIRTNHKGLYTSPIRTLPPLKLPSRHAHGGENSSLLQQRQQMSDTAARRAISLMPDNVKRRAQQQFERHNDVDKPCTWSQIPVTERLDWCCEVAAANPALLDIPPPLGLSPARQRSLEASARFVKAVVKSYVEREETLLAQQSSSDKNSNMRGDEKLDSTALQESNESGEGAMGIDDDAGEAVDIVPPDRKSVETHDGTRLQFSHSQEQSKSIEKKRGATLKNEAPNAPSNVEKLHPRANQNEDTIMTKTSGPPEMEKSLSSTTASDLTPVHKGFDRSRVFRFLLSLNTVTTVIMFALVIRLDFMCQNVQDQLDILSAQQVAATQRFNNTMSEQQGAVNDALYSGFTAATIQLSGLSPQNLESHEVNTVLTRQIATYLNVPISRIELTPSVSRSGDSNSRSLLSLTSVLIRVTASNGQAIEESLRTLSTSESFSFSTSLQKAFTLEGLEVGSHVNIESVGDISRNDALVSATKRNQEAIDSLQRIIQDETFALALSINSSSQAIHHEMTSTVALVNTSLIKDLQTVAEHIKSINTTLGASISSVNTTLGGTVQGVVLDVGAVNESMHQHVSSLESSIASVNASTRNDVQALEAGVGAVNSTLTLQQDSLDVGLARIYIVNGTLHQHVSTLETTIDTVNASIRNEVQVIAADVDTNAAALSGVKLDLGIVQEDANQTNASIFILRTELDQLSTRVVEKAAATTVANLSTQLSQHVADSSSATGVFSQSLLNGSGYAAFICALKEVGALTKVLGAVGSQSLVEVHRGLASCGMREESRVLYQARFRVAIDAVHGAVWSKNGADILAMVTGSGVLVMVNMSAGSSSTSVSLPNGNVFSMKPVSVHENIVAVGASSSDADTIYVYDAGNASRIHVHNFTHSDSVYAIAWHPAGITLASGGLEKRLRLWKMTNGSQLKVTTALPAAILCITWSPNGSALAAGLQQSSSSGVVKIFDGDSWVELMTLSNHTNDVSDVAWSPDGSRFASGSHDETVWVWTTADWTSQRTLQCSSIVYSVSWHSGGAILAAGLDTGKIEIWSAGAGTLLYTVGGESAQYGIAWHRSLDLLAGVDVSNTVGVWVLGSVVNKTTGG